MRWHPRQLSALLTVSVLDHWWRTTVGELDDYLHQSHTGYYGDYLARQRLPMRLLWHVVMPMLTRRFGYSRRGC
jgi:hypothetical protein